MKRKSAVVLALSLLIGVILSAASPPTAFAAPPSFRVAVSANSSTANARVTVPSSVQAGDQLVYVVTANRATTATTPAGWTLLGTASDGSPDMRSWVFTRTADGGTAGTAVTSTLGASSKVSRLLVAYSGAAAPTAATSSVMGARSVNLTTPAANVVSAETAVLSYWSDKSGGNTGWTLPASVTSRATSIGSGSGRITAALGETIQGVGNWPGATASSTVSGTKGIGWTILLAPATTSVPPVAAFTSSCALLACSFDGSTSSDPDGSITQYSWNFGDGGTASGATPNHNYASSGTYNVTLTVTDDSGASDSETIAVNAVVPAGAHTTLPPSTSRTDMPRITTGEIHDLEYIGNRVFVSGSFTSIRNNRGGNTTSYNQRFLAAFSLDTGLVDTNFRPTFDGAVEEIEASPDGTRLYVVGRFNTVNGVRKRKIAALNPTNGSVITGFTANANSVATAVEATNTTVYVGGQFATVNGVARAGLVALNASNGSVVTGFQNNLSGGIGVNGAMTVQAMALTPDLSKLLVVHTARQIAGQDRYGVGLISTQTNELLPWSTELWKDNLQFVGGIQRIYAGAISPDGSYFVVSSGSGGDRPPISDTAIAYSIEGGAGMEPLWISRMFDSVYSVAISDVAVYVGGHFNYAESPTAPDPWPGLTNVGYGRGQGLAGYGLGDDVVIRDHITALNPVDGKALEWNPGSNSFEGNKAMLVHPLGVITGGDAGTQGRANVGRVAVYDFRQLPTTGANETTIVEPIEGRVEEADVPFTITGEAIAASGVARVNLEVQDRGSNQYLQDDLVTFGGFNTIDADLLTPGANSTTWSKTVTISGNRRFFLRARTVGQNGSQDASKAEKTIETFGLADLTPSTGISSPFGIVPTLTFTMTGTASDDFGVNAIRYSLRDSSSRYLQDDGSVGSIYNTFQIQPDVVGATSATWQTEVTVPYESTWSVEAIAVDTAGQSDLRGATRDFIVSATATPPSVAITAPAIVNPPVAAAPITMAPGSPVTFSGIATDDEGLRNVEIRLSNSTTGERLSAGGDWGVDVSSGWYRISPIDVPGTSYNWSYTTPFNLTPGSYSFSVQGTDDLGLSTPSSNRGNLTINVQIPGDNPPNGLLDITGTQPNQPSFDLNLTGTATDDFGVTAVEVSIRDRDTARYVQDNGTMSATFNTLTAALAAPNATATTWSLAVTLPGEGEYDVTALAFDTAGQQDTSTSGATARYPVYPGDMPPVFNDTLFSPPEAQVFTEGRILVSGRVEDDRQIAGVQIAIRNSSGLYMNNSGAFTSSSPSWRPAFLNSPGSPGSNFSYTSPVIPAGAYTVFARGSDANGFVTDPPVERNVTVTVPDTNLPPVAAFTKSCTENVCTFDARSSTDENPTTLTYSWSFGQGSGSGPVPTRTYTSPGTFTVTVTVTDEWGATSTASDTVTIVEPAGNVPPVAVNNPPSCVYLVCNFSSVGSADPNAGDTISRSWNFGDNGTSTSTSPSRTFAAPGTYAVVLTVTDGWGKSSTATQVVTVEAAPTP